MKKDYAIDYLSCILFRLGSNIISLLPPAWGLFLGRRLGEIFYYLDFKHRPLVYSNLKKAVGASSSPSSLKNISKNFYRSFGQNLIEIFFIPRLDKEYMKKYIKIEGYEYVQEGFKRGKGVIFLGVHEGSWELSNIICANLGFPFVLFVRNQKFPRLNALLNSYRQRQGCRIIQRGKGARQLIEALRDNQSIGMTADQGGKSGVLLDFFGKGASIPSGAVRLALKYGAAIIPIFFVRERGPFIKIIVSPIFQVKRTGEPERDVQENLAGIVSLFEGLIRRYPHEYLWSYKIWKYGRTKNILILSDSKTGHLRQSQGLVKIISAELLKRGINPQIEEIMPSSGSLFSKNPEIVISCGSSLAALNLKLSRENQAKSVVIMKPPFFLNTGKFDLVIVPRHDNPPRRKNIVVTEGALNLIDKDYLKKESEGLMRIAQVKSGPLYLGVLIGGSAKGFSLGKDTIAGVIRGAKAAAEELDASILLTTSRRTPKDIEAMLKEEFRGYPRCRLLVVANEKNIPEAVGGILGLSSVVIISPESISMICEAVSSGKQVLVFQSPGLSKKHVGFLKYFAQKEYLSLAAYYNLKEAIIKASGRRERPSLNDHALIGEALKKIL